MKTFENGPAAAEGVVGDAPAIFVEDGGAMFIDVNVKIFLDGADYAAGVVLSGDAAAVAHAVDVAQIGIVERDAAMRGEMGKPRGDFGYGVFVEMAGIDKEEVDLRFQGTRPAPVRELLGKRNIVGVDESPVWIVGDLGAIVDIHADHGCVVRLGAGNQRLRADAAARAEFDNQPGHDGVAFKRESGEMVDDVVLFVETL